MKLIARKRERDRFKQQIEATESKLIAVYGRRRIGKTFLIREYFKEYMKFEISGLYQGDMEDQILHFTSTLVKYGYYEASLGVPQSWMAVFELLSQYLDTIKGRRKKVIFLDELPWMDTPRSKFLMAFENFWNSYCTKRKDLIVVICGSAASWMIQKILKNKGGLHNRVSERIHLQPFNLNETELFLKSKGILWSRYDIIQLYMTTGGVPFYLNAVKKGESVVQFINRVCFQSDGILYSECEVLYASLFKNSQRHEAIVTLLSQVKKGLTRKDIIEKSKFLSGGTLTRTLEELETSGFIQKIAPLGAKVNGVLYKLIDHYSIFYFQFMSVSGRRKQDEWTKQINSPSWRSWSGLAFERICFAHQSQIKKALGLQAIESEVTSWQGQQEGGPGAQIDMLIDRADNIVNVCEIKFLQSEFNIDKAQAANLRNKLAVFRSQLKSKRKSLFLTMITTFGVVSNANKMELIQNEVSMDDLFEN